MKFKHLILILLIVTGFRTACCSAEQQAVLNPIQSSQSSKHTKTDLDVLRLLQTDYFAAIKEIMGPKKTDWLTDVLLEKKIQNICKCAVFVLTMKLSSNSSNNCELETNKFKEVLLGFHESTADFSTVIYSAGDLASSLVSTFGIKYALLAYLLTGLGLKIGIDFASKSKFISLKMIERFEECIKNILAFNEKCNDPDDSNRMSPELFHEILNSLESDFLLVYDKVISENIIVFDMSFIFAFWNSLCLALSIAWVQSGHFGTTFVSSFIAIFLLYKVVLFSKNNLNKIKKLDQIYAAIKEIKMKSFKDAQAPGDTIDSKNIIDANPNPSTANTT